MVRYANILDKLEDLTDLEVAILLCLVAREHCLIDTELDVINELVDELRLVIEKIFGLSYAVIDCSAETSSEQFSNSILANGEDELSVPQSSNDIYGQLFDCIQVSQSMEHLDILTFLWYIDLAPSGGGESSVEKPRSPPSPNQFDNRKVVNVVIAKSFDQAPEDVQIQALELIRSKRIYTRAALHITPKDFIFIPVLSSNGRALSTRLNKHLNDHMFISHYHDAHDGLANLEESNARETDDRASLSSIIRKPPSASSSSYMVQPPVLQEEDIHVLRSLSDETSMSTDVNCYIQNIVVFLRLNRAVAGGISPVATRQFHKLVRCLASLHGVDYVPPSLAVLAAKKVYRHRIAVSRPENDRSMLYGSNIQALGEILADATPETIIDDVIAEVEAPL